MSNFLSSLGSSLLNGATSALGGVPGAFVSGLTGGLFDTLFGGIAANRQLKNQKKLMSYQMDLQKQMFDYTSEYNSMKNQVQRYKDAGLNPNLLTGQSQMAGTTGSISSGSAAMPLAQSQLQYAQHSQIASTTENLKADTDLKKSQVDLNTYLAIKEMYNGLEGKEKARVASVLADLSIDLARGELEQRKASTDLLNQQIVTEFAKRYNMSTQSALNIMKSITEGMQPSLIISQIMSANKQMSERDANIAYLGALKDQVIANKDITELKGKEQKIINEIKSFERDNWKTINQAELDNLVARSMDILRGTAPLGVKVPVGWITKDYKIK